LDNASTPSASGGCADASIQACNQSRSYPATCLATAQPARHKGSGLNQIKRITAAAPKIYFNLALFVCVIVIKCADEKIGERDHENILRSIISAPALMRITPCAFAQWMC
jgi:hypothetical protein